MNTEIPLHRISDFAPYGVSARLYGDGLETENWNMIRNWPLHRDDHYFFLIIEEGSGYLDIDFQRIRLTQGEFYAIAPGQIHGNVEATDCKAWVVLVAAEFISKEHRDILGRNMFRVTPHPLLPKEFDDFRDLLRILVRNVESTEHRDINRQLIRCITETFVTMAVKALSSTLENCSAAESRKYHIAIEFKELVRAHFIAEKSVQFYADSLHITSGYLNEVLKSITGQPTTYWIQDEILLEAKRLLAATDISVKQVAFRLGYENYSYFNRMFHEKTGLTPLQFRNTYLK